MKRITWLILLIFAITGGSFIQTYAMNSYKAMFNYQYKTSGTALDSCHVCHVAGSSKGRRNPYGKDFKKAGRSFNLIEEKDSDGDGFSNITEIVEGTFPGDPKSTPTRTEDSLKGDSGKK